MLALTVAVIGWFGTSKKESIDNSDIMSTLKSDMKYNTKQLEKIDERLTALTDRLDTTMQQIARTESDVKSGFKQLDILRDRVDNLERKFQNHE